MPDAVECRNINSDDVRVTVETSRQLVAHVDVILPPVAVPEECRRLGASSSLRRREIGKTEAGRPIEAYAFGGGDNNALFYGFPDPGEAVGGTVILALLHGLMGGDAYLTALDITWHFIPCLNFDDQPRNGRVLQEVFRDPQKREVDWCLSNPRSETTALLAYAKSVRPIFTSPLHDEYHSGESIPAYFGVSEVLSLNTCDYLRETLRGFGLSVQAADPHSEMGQGFAAMSRFGDEYYNSTFSVLAQYGLVLICEVSQEDVEVSNLVGAQLAAGLIALNLVLATKKA